MKKWVRLFIWILVYGFFATSCDDVFVDNISLETVQTIAPSDGQRIQGNLVRLQWDEVKGADLYRVRIFDGTNAIITDSLLETTPLGLSLNLGEYTWQVRGENGGFVTEYSELSSFLLQEVTNLDGVEVELVSPPAGASLGNGEITFLWREINVADGYDFEIFKEGALVRQSRDLTSDSVILDTSSLQGDGSYTWQVRAYNGNASTQFSSRPFTVDTKVPPQPSLETPANETFFSVTDEIRFSWQFIDTGEVQTEIASSIQIASDANFNTIVFSESGLDNNVTLTFEDIGIYFWRIRGIDEAGNQGEYGSSKSFRVN